MKVAFKRGPIIKFSNKVYLCEKQEVGAGRSFLNYSKKTFLPSLHGPVLVKTN